MTSSQCRRSTVPVVYAATLGAVLALPTVADVHDDHGDGPGTATVIALGEPLGGTLTAGDVDVFRFDLGGAGRVDLRTTGQADTVGELTDSAGMGLAMDDDGGTAGNFRMQTHLDRGIYYVRVTGGGDYAMDVRTVGVDDVHGDTLASSTLLPLRLDADVAAVWRPFQLGTPARLFPAEDVDVFRLDVPHRSDVRIRSFGAASLTGTLVDSGDAEIMAAGGDGNFDIGTTLNAGIYYVKVSADASGWYRVMAQHSGVPSAVVDSDGDGIPDGEDADRDGDGVANGVDAFPDDPAESVDADGNGVGDNADPIVTTYMYDGTFTDGSSVSYTGQTARQLLILGMVREIEGLTEDVGMQDSVRDSLRFYMTGEGADSVPHGFTVKGGEPVVPGPNYGDISTGKNLSGKIAGGNGEGGGETGRLIDDEFFGWEDGLNAGAVPIDLVWHYIDRLSVEATDGNAPQIRTVDGTVSLDTVQVDAHGRDYRQLLQKFLGGAVAFSQGTNDYFQTDWANALVQEDDKNFTAAEHDFDEAFGYYGASRNMNEYTDDEAAAKGGRDGWMYGYHDTNADGSIDVRSEVVLGHAQNCAKRDRGSGGATDYSKEAMDAFLAGRRVLRDAAMAGMLGDSQQAALHRQIETAAKTWEKCIAATVVHYINDVVGDMGGYVAPNFADLDNFKNMSKHWGEMKGFALALQFSPYSPFRDGSVSGITLDHLREVLTLMGDAPVLADGSQGGVAPAGDAQAAIDAYVAGLMDARDILEMAYGFDAAVVETW